MGETCKVAKAMASALSSMVDGAGGDVNSAAMDAHRSTVMFVITMSTVRALATAGLRSQGGALLSAVGCNEWPCRALDKMTAFFMQTGMFQYVPESDRQVWLEYLFGFTAALACPQSEASTELLRRVLRGTSTEKPSGVDALVRAQNASRDTYVVTPYQSGAAFTPTDM